MRGFGNVAKIAKYAKVGLGNLEFGKLLKTGTMTTKPNYSKAEVRKFIARMKAAKEAEHAECPGD